MTGAWEPPCARDATSSVGLAAFARLVGPDWPEELRSTFEVVEDTPDQDVPTWLAAGGWEELHALHSDDLAGLRSRRSVARNVAVVLEGYRLGDLNGAVATYVEDRLVERHPIGFARAGAAMVRRIAEYLAWAWRDEPAQAGRASRRGVGAPPRVAPASAAIAAWIDEETDLACLALGALAAGTGARISELMRLPAQALGEASFQVVGPLGHPRRVFAPDWAAAHARRHREHLTGDTMLAFPVATATRLAHHLHRHRLRPRDLGTWWQAHAVAAGLARCLVRRSGSHDLESDLLVGPTGYLAAERLARDLVTPGAQAFPPRPYVAARAAQRCGSLTPE